MGGKHDAVANLLRDSIALVGRHEELPKARWPDVLRDILWVDALPRAVDGVGVEVRGEELELEVLLRPQGGRGLVQHDGQRVRFLARGARGDPGAHRRSSARRRGAPAVLSSAHTAGSRKKLVTPTISSANRSSASFGFARRKLA